MKKNLKKTIYQLYKLFPNEKGIILSEEDEIHGAYIDNMPNIEFENIFDRIKNIVNDVLDKITNIDKQVEFLKQYQNYTIGISIRTNYSF